MEVQLTVAPGTIGINRFDVLVKQKRGHRRGIMDDEDEHMIKEAAPIDISTNPELAHIAHEAARTGRRQPLVENGAVIAVVAPVLTRRPRDKVTSREELQQVLAQTHGSWRGLIDPEEFKRQRRELQFDDREPRSL